MEVESQRKEQLNLFARTSNHMPDILPVPRGLREHLTETQPANLSNYDDAGSQIRVQLLGKGTTV